MLDQPFIIPSVIFIILALPLLFNLIPPNNFYGIRTKRTISDKLIWYRVNRFGGLLIILASVFYLVIAVLFPSSGSKDPDFNLWLVHLGAFLLPLILSFILISRYIKNI